LDHLEAGGGGVKPEELSKNHSFMKGKN